MSYENPNSPKYIPTAARSKEVGDAMLGVVKSQEEARQLEKDRLKADRTNELAWGLQLGKDFEGQQQEGALNNAYKDTGKYAAALNRMIQDSPEECKSENCTVEINQAKILQGLPNKSIEMLGTFESYLPILQENNVDKSQPLYTKMSAANGIIKKLNGFGSKDGYSVDIVLNKKDGNYTGSQELIFKAPCKKDTVDGCPFGESGEWRINSDTLKSYENNPESSGLLTSTPKWEEQATEIGEEAGIFDDETGGMTLNSDFLIQGEMDSSGVSIPLPVLKTKPVDGKEYEYYAYEYDTDKIRAKVGGYIAAEVDTMFDPSAGGPNDAIAMWNKTLAPTAKNLKGQMEIAGSIGIGGSRRMKISDFKFINKDGTMDWRAADTGINKPGTPGSIYAKNGELKHEVKELYKQVYTDHYMNTQVQKFITDSETTAIAGAIVREKNKEYKSNNNNPQNWNVNPS